MGQYEANIAFYLVRIMKRYAIHNIGRIGGYFRNDFVVSCL